MVKRAENEFRVIEETKEDFLYKNELNPAWNDSPWALSGNIFYRHPSVIRKAHSSLQQGSSCFVKLFVIVHRNQVMLYFTGFGTNSRHDDDVSRHFNESYVWVHIYRIFASKAFRKVYFWTRHITMPLLIRAEWLLFWPDKVLLYL